MRLLILWSFLLGWSLQAAEKLPFIVFEAGFEGSDALASWSPPPQGIRPGPGRAGSGGLLVERAAGQGPGSAMIQATLPAERLRGCRLRIEAQVWAANVAKPPNPWNGIKLMLHTDGPEGKRWQQQNNVFGSFDWRTIRFTTSVPDEASLAQLFVGLESTTGQARFDDIKVTVLRQPRPSGERSTEPRSRYRGHDLPRLRGTMIHPEISLESLRVLGEDWQANVLRWQLIRYVPPGQNPSVGGFRSWLEGELQKLDRALPWCARYGLRVVIDLHSPPGGSRTVSGYVGSDTGLFTNGAAQACFVESWQHMARRYRDNNVVWGYDLANEPVEEEVGDGCDDWQALATRTAEAIRQIDTRHAIIVEPSPWGGPDAIRNLDPLPVAGVVYSVHMYVPTQFTHQGIHGQPGGVTYPGQIGGRYWDKAMLRKALQPVVDFQKANNCHIFLGEFSAIRWAPGARDYLKDCIELFEEHGWDWTYHAFREWDGWSVEHASDPKDKKRSVTPTDRQKLLLEWFSQNQKPAGR